MKNLNHIFSLALIISLFFNYSCKQDQRLTMEEAQIIRNTIESRMDSVVIHACSLNAGKTYVYLSNDSMATFISDGMRYSRKGIIAAMSRIYSEIATQSIQMNDRRVTVLSQDLALWVGVGLNRVSFRDGKTMEACLYESWLWKLVGERWEVIHFHESLLPMPDSDQMRSVENALRQLEQSLAGRNVVPAEMPAVLTQFLDKNSAIRGVTLAFAPEPNENSHPPSPYLYRTDGGYSTVMLPVEFDYTKEGWYKDPVDKKGVSWVPPYFDTEGAGVKMITCSLPLYEKDGTLVGVLAADLALR